MSDCKKSDPCMSEKCQKCCVHEFDRGEGGCCLNCGKEGSDEMLADWNDLQHDA